MATDSHEPERDAEGGSRARAEGYARLADGDPVTLGPYRILKELGRGGQAVVHLAEDTRLHRHVALKVFTGLGPGSEDAVHRFRREAELASKLAHPGICGIHDAGIANGVPYIAMQYIEGSTLAQRISATRHDQEPADSLSVIVFSETATAGSLKDRPVTLLEAKVTATRREIQVTLGIFVKAARALHVAHEAGIVHRDIKPANIMVTTSGDPVILDFGLARAEDGESPALTRTGDVFGTPAYMSPEQISGQRARIDRRSDVYSLGASLYECLTLRRPFEAPTRTALYQAVLTRSPADPRESNRAISRDLMVVLETTLEKDLDRRYATAEALSKDLQSVLDGRPIQARPVGPVGRFVRWSKREPAKAALVFVLLAALPTIATLVTSHLKDRPQLEAARIAGIEREKDAILSAAGYEVTEGDPKKAVELYSKALGMEGGSSEAAGGLIIAQLALKNADAALAILDRHREELGEGAAAVLLRADVLEALGTSGVATEALRASAPPPRTAFEHTLLATKHLAAGEAGDHAAFRRALEHATLAILLSPAPRLPLFTQQAHAAGHLGDRDAAIGAAAGLRAHWPDTSDAQDWRGFALAGCDDPVLLSDAIAAGREAIRLRPDRASAHGNLGRALGLKGATDEALAVFQKGICLDPDDARMHYNLGTAFIKIGRYDDAIAALREAVRLKPEYADATCNLGIALAHRGLFDDALPILRDAVRLSPGDAGAHAALGATSSAKGLLDDGIAALSEAIRLQPGDADANYNLSIALADSGRIDDAIAAYRETLRLAPGHAEAHCNLAFLLREMHQPRAALDVVRRGHEFGRQRPDWGHPSEAWVAEFEQDAAGEDRIEERFREYVEAGTEPESARDLVSLARFALERDQPVLAARWYEAAFAESPELADSLPSGHRRLAAHAAARAAAAVRAASPDSAGIVRSPWRLQSLAWLEEEVASAVRAWNEHAISMRQFRVVLLPLTRSPDFAPTRESGALEILPDVERLRWQKLWSEVSSQLAALDGTPVSR